MYLISDGGIVSCNISNTYEAIMLTKNLDYLDGVKLDLQFTKDKIIVLFPSDKLNKITFSNKKISEVDYAYLKKVKFPSHIFHYRISTLEEILNKYNHHKIIVLKINNYLLNNTFLETLYQVISKYNYKYYYLVDDDFVDKIKNSNLFKIGKLVDENFIITKYPEKYLKYESFFDNNFN